MAAIYVIFNGFDVFDTPLESPSSAASLSYTTVIIDAGHGGEDGGTSSASGLVEKDLNLEISFMLRDMLEANGISVIMTREDDRLLYDRNVNFHGKKKVLDLAARLGVAQSTADAIFVSIHMNAFPDPKYSGLQVWFSPNGEEAYELANKIQTNTHNMLQPQNDRKVKQATSKIFLLNNAVCPAVLVECGFLSNPQEAELLASKEYKQKLCFILFSSINEFLIEKSDKSP
jgi:N-acetylmuramoyl-L-alanine amidase